MLYGYFHKGVFLKFFLNFDKNDKSFFENMRRPLGHQEKDVELYAYPTGIANNQTYIFDENKNLVFIEPVEIQVAAPTEEDPNATTKVISYQQTNVVEKQEFEYK